MNTFLIIVSFSFIFLRRKLTLMQWLGIGTIIVGLILVGAASFISPDPHNTSKTTTGQQIAGIVLLLTGMLFTGLQVD